MSEDFKAIALIEVNDPPNTSIYKEKKYRKKDIFSKIIFSTLLLFVIILIITMIIIIFKKCYEKVEEKTKKEKARTVRNINPYWNDSDLPNYFKPNDYVITLQLLKEANTLKLHNSSNYFYGNVVINFMTYRSSKFIVLNTKMIAIQNVKLKCVSSNENKKVIDISELLVDEFHDQTILVFKDNLQKSVNYSIEISYTGNITLSKGGIIRTFYRSFILNKIYDILYSKLEPKGARRMFPCFDEPDMKALFVLKIIHYSKYIALSNMPILKGLGINQNSLIHEDNSISKNVSLKLSIFSSTFIYMSTYLVAFVLLEDYEKLQQNRKPNLKVSIWAPKGFLKSSEVPLKYAIYGENYLEFYLNFSSPLLKTDHVCIPNFLSGAMENWGLITYKENRLLMHPRQEESISAKAYMTIAHELAHIWFGNWVTMKTWKDLWLNEGFATYFASMVYYKQLNVSVNKSRELFVFQYREILDAIKKKIYFPVRQNERRIENIFNSITYKKGQAMLIWLNSIMSENKFHEGIKSYIKKYSQNNPTTKKFFQEMQKQGTYSTVFKMSFDKYFYPWLNKIGYPILTVNYNISNKQLILTQKSVISNSTTNTSWPIYTSFKTNFLNLGSHIFFKGKNYKMNITLGDNDFIILNSDGTSYLRVNYNNYLWGKIISNIREYNKKINTINKIILFDDNFFFAYSGFINISITKNLMDTLVNETNSVLWTLFYNRIFTKMYDLLRDNRIFLKWTKYVKQLSNKSLEKAFTINIDGDLNVDEEIFQKQLFLMNCAIDNQEMLDFYSNKFQVWIKSPKNQTLPKHLVTSILYYGLRENDKEEYWIKLWKIMIENNMSNLINKDQIAIGLAGTSRPYRLNKLLNYILTPGTHNSDYNKQTFVNELVSWVLKSDIGVNSLSRWILKKSKEIKKYAFGDNVSKKGRRINFNKLLALIASTSPNFDFVRSLATLHSNKEALVNTFMLNNEFINVFGKIFLQYL